MQYFRLIPLKNPPPRYPDQWPLWSSSLPQSNTGRGRRYVTLFDRAAFRRAKNTSLPTIQKVEIFSLPRFLKIHTLIKHLKMIGDLQKLPAATGIWLFL